MHSEAIGSVWTFSKNFDIFGFLNRFSTFPDVIFTKDFFHGTICCRYTFHFIIKNMVHNKRYGSMDLLLELLLLLLLYVLIT